SFRNRRVPGAVRQLDRERQRRPFAALDLRDALSGVNAFIMSFEVVVPRIAASRDHESGLFVGNPDGVALARNNITKGYTIVESARLDSVVHPALRVLHRKLRAVEVVD